MLEKPASFVLASCRSSNVPHEYASASLLAAALPAERRVLRAGAGRVRTVAFLSIL